MDVGLKLPSLSSVQGDGALAKSGAICGKVPRSPAGRTPGRVPPAIDVRVRGAGDSLKT